MKNSLTLGKIAGIKIFMHWTFPVIILWIIVSSASRGLNTGQIIWSVVFTLSLFVCVVLHELGHALAARRYHIQTKDILLLPIGGIARLERMPDKPVQELIVALAGPAVNLLIVLILHVFVNLAKMPSDISEITYINADNFLLSLSVLNLWLAIFNLIPAFPMDGGRVLRALLSLKFSRAFATRIAARLGQAVAIFFIFIGFFYNPFLVFIGLFVFFGAMAESEYVQVQSALKNMTVRDITMKNVPLLNRKDTLGKAIETLLNGQAKKFLVMDGDKPFGILGKTGIIEALQRHSQEDFVEVATDRNPGYIDAAEPIENALLMMQNYRYPMLIVTRDDELYGLADMENIKEFIEILNAAASPATGRETDQSPL